MLLKVGHGDPSVRIGIHSDAYNAHQDAAATRSEARKIGKPAYKQNYLPLPFPSAPFSPAQEHWFTYENCHLRNIPTRQLHSCLH